MVLGLSFLFEGGSWLVAVRRFSADARRFGYYQAFVRSKDPPAFMVLLEDSAALVGIVIAAAATAAAVWLAQPVWDGVGSILIGLLLAVASIGLAREQEPPDRRACRSRACALHPRHRKALAGRAPGQRAADSAAVAGRVVAALSIEFADDKRADDIEQCVISIETEIRKRHPSVAALFIKPQTNARFHAVRARRFG